MRDTGAILYRVYIDEAGDRGISRRASDHFVVSAVIVRDADDAQVRAELGNLRSDLGRRAGEPLHFLNFSHSQRLYAVQATVNFSIHAITSVILCKEPLRDKQETRLTSADPMYLYVMRLLLERVSWCIAANGGTEAKVTFAEVKGFKAEKLHAYRRLLEAREDVSINWAIFNGHPFQIDRPPVVELLQVADTAASALYRAVEPDDFKNTERRYLEELRGKIYRRPTGSVTSYGLKTFPAHVSKPGGQLDFLLSH